MKTLKTNRLLIELKPAPYLIKKSLDGLRNIANYGTRNGKKISGPRFIDSFKNVKTLEAAQKIVGKRNINSIKSAIYFGKEKQTILI